MDALHKRIIKRLMLAWFITSVLVGTVVYFYELEKIDDSIVELASIQAKEILPYGAPLQSNKNAVSALAAQISDLIKNDFLVVEIYDKTGSKILESIASNYESVENAISQQKHPFPHDGKDYYERFNIDNNTYIQVLIPLFDMHKQLNGFFEGLYLIEKNKLAAIEQKIWDPIIIALFVIFVTTAILYPVIVNLNKDVIRFSNDVVRGNLDTAGVLGSAIALRDSDTGSHNYRVTLYAIRLAEELQQKQSIDMKALILGSFLHDVGKIGISDNILLKPGKLTAEEFEIMKTHVSLGVDIINNSPWLSKARDIIEYHHEKFNGAGYLKGLSGKAIPITARIFSIVDVFDALTSKRPYKEPFPFEVAMEIISKDAGTHFDPEIVETFKKIALPLHTQYANAREEYLVEALTSLTNFYYIKHEKALT